MSNGTGLLDDCGLLTIENYEECIKARESTISDADVATTMLYSSICGLVCYLTFSVVRKFDNVYQTRLELPWIWVKPPKLRLDGLHIFWSWMAPVINLSDIQVLKTSGIDALVFLRCTRLAIQLFLPITVLSCAILIPVHKFCADDDATVYVYPSQHVVRTYSMSAFNLPHASSLYWIHFTLIYLYIMYSCWLLLAYYKAIVRLRQDHFFISGEDYNPWVQHFLGTDHDKSEDDDVAEDAEDGRKKDKRGVLGLVERMATFISPTHIDEDEGDAPTTTVQLTADMLKGGGNPFLEQQPPDLERPSKKWFSFTKKAPKDKEGSKAEEKPAEDPMPQYDAISKSVNVIPEEESVHHAGSGSEDDTMVIHDPADAPEQPRMLRTTTTTMRDIRRDGRSFTLNDKLLLSTKSFAGPLGDEEDGHDDDDDEGTSRAVYHWWEEHKGGDDLPPLLGKPTVRFRKMVNVITDDGKNFGVNAQQYAVLVRDLPSFEWERVKKDIKFAVYRTAVDLKLHQYWPFSMLAKRSNTLKSMASETDAARLQDLEAGGLLHDQSFPGSVKDSMAGTAGGATDTAVSTGHRRNVSLATLKQRFLPWLQKNNHSRSDSNVFETWEQRQLRRSEEQLEFIDNHFRKLFPDSFLQAVPVRPQKDLDYLLYLYDETIQQLDVAEEIYNRTGKRRKRYVNPLDGFSQGFCVSWFGMGYTCFCCCKPCCRPCMGFTTDAIDWLTARKQRLEGEIFDLRQKLLTGPGTGTYFVLFNNQRDTAVAVQSNLFAEGPGAFTVERAPGPDEINWSALWVRSYWRRQLRVFMVLPFILLLLVFPVSIFAASMAELNIALCADPTSAVYSEWYCSSASKWLQKFVTSMLPSVLMVAYESLVMPMSLYYLVLAQRSHTSFTALDLNIGALYFAWNFFNFFLGGLLGGTILAQLSMVANDPGAVYDLVGTALSTQCNFFVNYVIFRALGTSWLKMLYPHFNIVPGIFFGLGIAKSRTPRQKAMQIAPHNLRYGREYGVFLLVMLVSLSFAVIAPMMLPFTLVYYLVAYCVYKYQVLYVYERSYESGGMHWPFVFTRICWCLFLMTVMTSCMLISNKAFVQGTVLLLTVTPFLYQFHRYCTMRYAPRMEHIPMEIADAMPKAFLDPAMYLPPSLRDGSVGWYPEYGKAWEYWWMPLYTL